MSSCPAAEDRRTRVDLQLADAMCFVESLPDTMPSCRYSFLVVLLGELVGLQARSALAALLVGELVSGAQVLVGLAVLADLLRPGGLVAASALAASVDVA